MNDIERLRQAVVDGAKIIEYLERVLHIVYDASFDHSAEHEKGDDCDECRAVEALHEWFDKSPRGRMR